MIRQILVFIIFLISSEFFKISFIPKGLNLLTSFACTIFLILAVTIWAIYEKKQGFKENFSFEIVLFLLSAIGGIIGAKIGHDQSFFLSAWVQNYMFFYFFYFFLHMIKLRPYELERIMIIIAIIYFSVFFLQYIIHPKLITFARVSAERGTVRIFLPGGSFAMIMFFYFLQKALQSNNLRYAIFCLVYLMTPILQGTRNAIATILFASMVVILVSKRVKSRLGVIFMTGLAAVLFFFIFQDIIFNLIEVSSNQVAQEEDDVRERSATFYLTDFYPDKLNYIIGNGFGHMRSTYGLKIMYYQVTFGFYQSDLGIISGYVKFGVLFVIAIILTLRKIVVIRIDPKYNYIKFWTIILVIQSILGSPYVYPSSIVTIAVALYIIDVSNYELKSS